MTSAPHAPPIEFTQPDAASLTQMHPALDIVDGTLYVTVQASIEGLGLQHVVLSSDGNLFLPDGWANECKVRGLLPRAEVNLTRCGPRWTQRGLQLFQAGKLKSPDWQKTFVAIHDTLDARLVVSDPTQLDVLALFAMMTYFHPLFDYLPILHLRGPAASGKSRAGNALAHIAFNGISLGSPTRSVTFRLAHLGRFTQVLAEGDHLAVKDSGDDFARDLQASCSKGEATVEVAEGKSAAAKGAKGGYEPTTFYTFSPRVILSTKAFKSQPLRSRCIELDFVRALHPDMRKLGRSVDDDSVWEPLRHRMYKHQLLQWRYVWDIYEWLRTDWYGQQEASGRTRDNWLPLAVMAALVSDDVLDTVKALAREEAIRHQQDMATTFEAAIMKFAWCMVRDGNDQEFSRRELYEAFIGTEEIMGDWEDDKHSPAWARATETTVTREQLRQWVKGPQSLLTEMQRLTLIPKGSIHLEKGNLHHLDAQHIRDMAESHFGPLSMPEDGDDE